MQADILLIFDLNTKQPQLTDDLKETARECLRGVVENVLKKHFDNDESVELVFSTTNTYPSLSNAGSTKCTVQHIPSGSHGDTYLISGNSKLCKDVQKMIGSQAKIKTRRINYE